MTWPAGIRVGHTLAGRRLVIVNGVEMTPEQARDVAREIILRADFQDRTVDTRTIDEVPRRVTPAPSSGV